MAVVYIDIENSIGQKQGSGPIISASRWRSVARMDKAGTFEFEMPASDQKAVTVRKKFIARAYCFVNGQRIEVGAGIIDRIQKQPQADGKVVLRVSGDDLVRELTYRSVLDLKLYLGGNPVSHATAIAAVGGYAPAGWGFTADPSPANNLIYGYFNGETVLAGMIKVAQKSQNHFYRGTGRSLVFASSFTSSGVRAIQARGELSPTTCAIVSLTEQIDTYDLITRIYPRGSGNANAQLTLRGTSRVAPGGFTLNAVQNYIQNDTAIATYGVIERQVDFRDIGPVDNTDADIVAAANMLFDAGLETLKQRSTEIELATYTVQLAGCSQLLRPMQTIRLVYRDLASAMDINTDLNILEATWQVDSSGVYTTALKVSNADRWPKSDVGTIVDGIEQGNVYQALPQLNANSYVTAYNKNVDSSHIASFRFRFGDEVTQLSQVLFEFQLLEFESTVKAVGGATSGSGAIPTGGPSTNDSGLGGNNDSGSATPTINSTTPTINATTPTISTTTPTIGTTTPTIGTTTPTIGSSTPTLGTVTPTIGSTTPTLGSTGLTTNTPTGGVTDGSGDHQHAINVIAGSGSLGAVSLHFSGGFYFLANPFVTGSEPVYVTPVGFHTHTLSQHTHTIDPHTHTIGGHTHTITSHTHTVDSHTHTIGGHNHTIDGHTHTMSGHTHTMSAHTHTMSGHTHTMSSHTHSLNNHIHDLSESIEAIYGIYREEDENTYTVDDLRYRVNGGSWDNLSDAVNAGDGWYQLDITSQVMNSTTFRPLQANNLLEIEFIPLLVNSFIDNVTSVKAQTNRFHFLSPGDTVTIINSDFYDGTYTVASVPDPASFTIATAFTFLDTGQVAIGKTATIDAQLSVRNIIQAVAYA